MGEPDGVQGFAGFANCFHKSFLLCFRPRRLFLM